MPTDISAGLIALAASPPNAAISADPAQPEPLNVSLFATLLTRSKPPGLAAAAPPPISLKTTLAANLKTMDTLPTLSFPPATKAKDKASELLLPPPPMSALLVPPVIGLVTPASPAAPAPSASFLPSAPVPPQTVPDATQAALPQSALPQSALPQSALPQAALPQAALPVPAPLAKAQAIGKATGPESMLTRILDMEAPLPMAEALPLVPSPVQAMSPAQSAPQTPMLATLPVLATLAAVSTLVPTAASPEPVKLAPAKTAGKIGALALKVAAGNADTSTRILQGQTEVVFAKEVVSAEKHAPEHEVAAATNDGKSALLFMLPVTDTAKADAKPLTAGERAEVIKQAADGVGAMPLPAKPGATEQMSLQLHPKDWGRLEVSVTVVPGHEDGTAKTVTAHIVAETLQVKAALQSGTGALHEALRTSGLHLEHLTVSVKLPEAQNTPSGQFNHSGQGSGFGTGSWQNNHRQQPLVFAGPVLNEPDIEAVPFTGTAIRLTQGRLDIRA